MNISNQENWNEWVENNQDGYGLGVLRYAVHWADLMETRLSIGEELENMAQETSHEANTEGITGFMYGAAVAVLATCWEHGEQLRQWHNLSAQIRNEGEKANQEGGVLNPAVLCLGEP